MVEAEPAPRPENLVNALRVMAMDMKPEISFEDKDLNLLLIQAAGERPTKEEEDRYRQARRKFRKFDPNDKRPLARNAAEGAAGQLLREGNPDFLKTLVEAYEQGNYRLLVQAAAGWNTEAVMRAIQSAKTQGTSQEDLLSAVANMMVSQGGEGGGVFGAPKYVKGVAIQMPTDIAQFIKDGFKDTASPEATGKGKERLLPVSYLVPDDFQFSEQFSDPDPQYWTEAEKQAYERLDWQLRFWTLSVDTLTRVGSYQQLAQVWAQTMVNFGLDTMDFNGELPKAIGPIMKFAHALRGSTEKAADEIGGSAPSPIQVEAVERMMQRELVVEAIKANGESVYVRVPISTWRFQDVITGNTAEQARQHELKLIHPKFNRGRPFYLAELFAAEQMSPKADIKVESLDLDNLGRLEIIRDAEKIGGRNLNWTIMHDDLGTDPVDVWSFLNDADRPKNEKVRILNEAQLYAESWEDFPAYQKDGVVAGRNRYNLGEFILRNNLSNDQRKEIVGGEKIAGEGVPLYVHPGIRFGSPFTLASLNQAELAIVGNGKLEAVLSSELGPTQVYNPEADRAQKDFLRHVGAESYSTTESAWRLIGGKEFIYDDVMHRLELQLAEYNLGLEDVVGFEHEKADGLPLNINDKAVNALYKDKLRLGMSETEAKIARTQYMLGELVYVRYGMMNELAFDLAEVMQQSFQWDPAQLMDHLAELWIKAFGPEEYSEKYGLDPAALRPELKTFLKPLICWKMKNIDVIMNAMSGEPQFAYWQNPPRPDEVETIPQILGINGAKITKDQKLLIESIFYDRTDYRVSWSDRHTELNYLRILSEELLKEKDLGRREKISKGMEELSGRFLENTQRRYGFSSPQAMPRSRNDALAVVNALSPEKRALLEGLDFKELLRVVGYKQMQLPDYEYQGWLGLVKLTESRSTRHFGVGRLEDKLFKYEGKYPGMATAVVTGLRGLITAINQSSEPWMLKYLGGKPDRIGNMTPDSAVEGIVAGAMDWTLFFNHRTSEEARAYIEDVFKNLEETVKAMGYMDQFAWRSSTADLLLWMVARCAKDDQVVNYELTGGRGENGTQRKRVEIPLTPPEDIFISVNPGEYDAVLSKWAKGVRTTIRSYRRAGARVVFPDQADIKDLYKWASRTKGFDRSLLQAPEHETQVQMIVRMGKLRLEAKRLGFDSFKDPYVVAANSPVYKYGVYEEKGTLTPVLITGTGLARYDHRGGDPLMMAVLIRLCLDRQLIDIDDANAINETLKAKIKKNAWYNNIWGRWMKHGAIDVTAELQRLRVEMANR